MQRSSGALPDTARRQMRQTWVTQENPADPGQVQSRHSHPCLEPSLRDASCVLWTGNPGVAGTVHLCRQIHKFMGLCCHSGVLVFPSAK